VHFKNSINRINDFRKKLTRPNDSPVKKRAARKQRALKLYISAITERESRGKYCHSLRRPHKARHLGQAKGDGNDPQMWAIAILHA
jgi:hypothetical protein